MAENSTDDFVALRFGEWETIGDRVRRRPVYLRSSPAMIWNYRYEISRNYEGEIFTAYTDIPPDMLLQVDNDMLNMILRNAFFSSMGDSVKKREGNWVKS